MGLVKSELDRIESLNALAIEPLIKSGAVEECFAHSGVIISRFFADDIGAAYAIGTNMVKRGEVDGTREEFMEAIKGAYEDTVDECPICAKHRNE